MTQQINDYTEVSKSDVALIWTALTQICMLTGDKFKVANMSAIVNDLLSRIKNINSSGAKRKSEILEVL